MASDPGARLRGARLDRGFTQAELAARAGVSRQLVAAVETGRNAPAVDAALGLAAALATTVEELFAPRSQSFVPALGNRLPDGTAVRLGRVAGQLVVAALADHGAAGGGWAAPDGVLQGGELNRFPGAVPAGLVIAGCDPALGIAEAMLAGQGPRSLLAVSAPTGTALRALAQGTVHAAVVHGPAGALPRPPIPVVRWHLARWQVGLALPRGLRADSAEAILTRAPVVQRDPAATSQQAFERFTVRAGVTDVVPGPRAAGHIDAARSAAILGAPAVTTESAADAFALDFRPVERHTVEVWLAGRFAADPAAVALGELLGSPGFVRRVGQFGGYELDGCGTTLAAGE